MKCCLQNRHFDGNTDEERSKSVKNQWILKLLCINSLLWNTQVEPSQSHLVVVLEVGDISDSGMDYTQVPCISNIITFAKTRTRKQREHRAKSDLGYLRRPWYVFDNKTMPQKAAYYRSIKAILMGNFQQLAEGNHCKYSIMKRVSLPCRAGLDLSHTKIRARSFLIKESKEELPLTCTSNMSLLP